MTSALALGAVLGFGCLAKDRDARGTDSGALDGGAPDRNPRTDGSPDGSVAEDAAVPGLTPSETPRLKRKNVDVLRRDLADGLAIPPAQLCRELDKFDCFDAVHKIPLGGVEPYVLGIYEPLPESASSSPIATDRVVLASCRERVDVDIAGDIVIFELPVDGAAMTEGARLAARASLDRLYQRLLRRRAEPRELDHLMALYSDVEASGESRPSRSWAILACFVVGTSLEALFY
ncbi:MAG: hypothetical protein HYV07_00280 [Deltaproteobacteria bacterium]|nr:hypothetical protein [Deltaproteobacteria bacterium]